MKKANPAEIQNLQRYTAFDFTDFISNICTRTSAGEANSKSPVNQRNFFDFFQASGSRNGNVPAFRQP